MSDRSVSLSAVEEVAREIYGDGAWEITKALADVSKAQKKDRTRRALENVAIAGNAASTVAGPAAIYAAVRNRKGGGIPRDVTKPLAARAMRSQSPRVRQAGVRTARLVRSLDKPMSRRAKIAAGVAGGTMVGLQVANTGTDAISTKLLADQKKKDVSKALGVLKPKVPTTPKTPGTGKSGMLRPKMPKPPTPTKSPAGAPRVAPVVRKNHDFKATWEISKADTDKRQVFGWASVTEMDGQPVVDLQGDFATIDVIEKAAYDYVHTSRKGGDMHRREGTGVIHKSDLVESFVVTPDKKKIMGLPDSTPTGWWVGFQVNDDDLWQMVKDGKRPQFSIHGTGQRVEKVL